MKIILIVVMLGLTACNRSQIYERCDPHQDCYVNGDRVYKAQW
jgi:hypothetical protein